MRRGFFSELCDRIADLERKLEAVEKRLPK